MSGPDPATEEKLLQYVECALALNPLDDSAAIIHSRSRLLGLAAAAPASAVAAPLRDVGQDRQKLLDRVELLRRKFWKEPLPQLRSALDQLHADEFPDIDAVVRRL